MIDSKLTALLRSQDIDLLRGIGIFLVLLHHFQISYHLENSIMGYLFPKDFIFQAINNGYYGLTILFTASGFLITQVSLKRYSSLNRFKLADFYYLRAARILPCLFLFLSLIVIFSQFDLPIFKSSSDSFSLGLTILSILTFWHNILLIYADWYHYTLNILWSLSVTETFYLIFPILCLAFKNQRMILLFLAACVICAPVYRYIYRDNELIAMCSNIACLDSIAIGCITAIVINNLTVKRSYSKMLTFIGVGLMISIYFLTSTTSDLAIGVLLTAIGCALVLAGRNNISTNNTLIKGVSWLGKNCFEVYLFHIIVLAFMKEMISPNDLGNISKLAWFAIFIFTTVVLAGLVAKYFSVPLNKKLRQIKAKPKTNLVNSEAS